MLRISLLACVALILGVTAKPYEPWNKLTDEALQDTVMSNDKGKIPWGVEVEPPEDMDGTDYDIDPKMAIWSKMDKEDKQPKQAEADLDELYHPSMADLLKAQNFNLDIVPAADIQEEPVQEDVFIKHNQQPEEDKDDINHPDFTEVDPNEHEQDWDDVYRKAVEEQGGNLAPIAVEHRAAEDVPVKYFEAEKDEDDLYHHDNQPAPVQIELLQREAQDKIAVRIHLEPEEDMDDLYHKDLPQPIPDQHVAVPADLPSQRKRSEDPEEDLDGIYHQ